VFDKEKLRLYINCQLYMFFQIFRQSAAHQACSYYITLCGRTYHCKLFALPGFLLKSKRLETSRVVTYRAAQAALIAYYIEVFSTLSFSFKRNLATHYMAYLAK